MPRGASPKRQHEYQELEHKFKEEGRYPGREAEVAARIVNQQRAESGEAEQSHGHPNVRRGPRRGKTSTSSTHRRKLS